MGGKKGVLRRGEARRTDGRVKAARAFRSFVTACVFVPFVITVAGNRIVAVRDVVAGEKNFCPSSNLTGCPRIFPRTVDHKRFYQKFRPDQQGGLSATAYPTPSAWRREVMSKDTSEVKLDNDAPARARSRRFASTNEPVLAPGPQEQLKARQEASKPGSKSGKKKK
jgi:hypothetical protein